MLYAPLRPPRCRELYQSDAFHFPRRSLCSACNTSSTSPHARWEDSMFKVLGTTLRRPAALLRRLPRERSRRRDPGLFTHKEEASIIRPVPAWQIEALRSLRSQLLSPSPPFPCIFAVTAAKRRHLRFAFIDSATDPDAWGDLVHVLTRYSKIYRTISRTTSLIVFFKPEETPLSLGEYEERFWEILQFLHEHDPKPWPAELPRDPTEPLWEFSFAGEPMFVVCTTPAHRQRRSRSSKGFVITFQPRWVFEDLGIDTRRGRQARERIRKRLRRYDGVPAYPGLGPYGTPEYREWAQYFLPDSNDVAKGECPLQLQR
jgi:uncharacterized protein